jgi:hypothetical protein
MTTFDGLSLWAAVEKTDARYTKDITGKAFRGTTVNNIHVARKITAVLGPVGFRWGWNVLDERVQEFGHHEDKTYKALHWVRVAMWIKGEDGSKETFENFGTTVMASYTRNGFSLDDEAPKKSMTDALSKLMVYLGGSADVWLNQFDPHNKYAGDDDKPAPRPHAAAPAVVAVATGDAPDVGEAKYLLEGYECFAATWIEMAAKASRRRQGQVLLDWWAGYRPTRELIYRRHEAHRDALAELSADIKARGHAADPSPSAAQPAPAPADLLRAG